MGFFLCLLEICHLSQFALCLRAGAQEEGKWEIFMPVEKKPTVCEVIFDYILKKSLLQLKPSRMGGLAVKAKISGSRTFMGL